MLNNSSFFGMGVCESDSNILPLFLTTFNGHAGSPGLPHNSFYCITGGRDALLFFSRHALGSLQGYVSLLYLFAQHQCRTTRPELMVTPLTCRACHRAAFVFV